MRITDRFLGFAQWFFVIFLALNFFLQMHFYLENRSELLFLLNENARLKHEYNSALIRRSYLLDSLSFDYQNKHSNLKK